METESKALQTLPCKTQEHSDSTDALIREWLFRFGVEHKEDVAPRLPLWLEAFGGMDADTLEKLFRRAIRSCKFFPRVAEILEPIESSPLGQQEAELKWTRVLDYCRIYVTPDLPVPSYAPKITERTMTAIRAAGGLYWIQSCPSDDLVWAKKAFIESYAAWAVLKRDEYLLPDGPVKNLIAGIAEVKELPASK
jgi:hypothetical protein